MEELQTTEILDREILEDARKKAYRILKTADDAVKIKAGEWEKKRAAAIDELGKKYAARRTLAAAEIVARLPMEKRRVKAEKIESLIQQAVETWYVGLSREQVLSILKIDLARCIKELTTNRTNVRFDSLSFHKLERTEAEAILKDLLPDIPCEIAELPSCAEYPAIMLENSEVRISVSISKTVDFFLHEKRAELAEALLGKAALLEEAAPC